MARFAMPDAPTAFFTARWQGLAFSIDGSPPRPIPWIEGLTFGRDLRRFIFRRQDGDTGPVTELRFSMLGAHMILRKP